jgi:Ca2+-binding EF-hand superfamily protein
MTLRITRNCILVQSFIRGCLTRKRFREKILENLKHLNANRYQPLSHEFIMEEMVKAVRKRGLTMEILFRCTDLRSIGSVSIDEFGSRIRGMRLGVSASVVSKFLSLADEDGDGKITREHYMELLQAFNVNSETPSSSSAMGVKRFSYA